MLPIELFGKNERGETQLSVILWVIGLGIAFSIIYSIQSWFSSAVDERDQRRKQQFRDKYARKPAINRKVKGYKVKY